MSPNVIRLAWKSANTKDKCATLCGLVARGPPCADPAWQCSRLSKCIPFHSSTVNMCHREISLPGKGGDLIEKLAHFPLSQHCEKIKIQMHTCIHTQLTPTSWLCRWKRAVRTDLLRKSASLPSIRSLTVTAGLGYSCEKWEIPSRIVREAALRCYWFQVWFCRLCLYELGDCRG